MRPGILNWDRSVRRWLPSDRWIRFSFQVLLRFEIQLWYMLKLGLYNCGKQGHVEKLTIAKLVSKFSACCETRSSIVVFTEASGQCPEQIKRVQNLIFSLYKSSFNIIRPPTRRSSRSFRVFRQKFPVPLQSPMPTTCPGHLIIFFLWRSSPTLASATLLLRFLDHKRTHKRYYSSERVISSSQRPLPP